MGVLQNAADAEEFGLRTLTSGVLHNPVRLVYHGTLTRLYGVDLAIHAVAVVRARGLALTFDVFGPGPEMPALRQLVGELGLVHAVILHGPVSHHHLREVLPTFDAGLVPTRLDGMTKYSLSAK